MTSSGDTSLPISAWSQAVLLLERWIELHERVDALLDQLPRTFTGVERGRCQSLLFGAVRHKGRLQAHLYSMMDRPPRARLQAVLLVAGYELLEGGDEHHVARVVHHAVEQAKTLTSPPEARMVNAVVRKLATALAAEVPPPKLAQAEDLARYFSHPDWLVKRWLAQYGAPATRQLLEWNQQPATVHARWRSKERAPGEAEALWLKPTQWPEFFEIIPGHWPEVEAGLKAGLIYLQDPSTRLAVDLLAPQSGETILDGCAAPGGKSVLIGDCLAGTQGKLVAMDLPGSRIDRLKENLGRVLGTETVLIQGDVAQFSADAWAHHGLTGAFQAVLLDVPCSNTGVIRHRVDVKWRLMPNDLAKHARQQGALLWAASRWVAPGGRLVYSTCSLDDEENEFVVKDFIERARGRFALEGQSLSRPWETGCDGAGAFLLRRAP